MDEMKRRPGQGAANEKALTSTIARGADPQSGGCLPAALSYVATGFAVVPILGKRPHPLLEHGYADASSDIEVIRGWYRRAPRAGVGIAAGEALVLVDVDDEGGLAELESWYRPVPETLRARSGGGGLHLYFLRPATVRLRFLRDRFPAGVEVKLGNAGLVAPPSVHPESGRRYRWVNWGTAIADAPDWLIGLLTPPPVPRAAPSAPACDLVGDGSRYGLAALRAKVALVAIAPEGTRQTTLNGAAFALGQLVASGQLSERAAGDALWQAAVETGLPAAEIRRTIACGLRDGQKHPFYLSSARGGH